MRPASVIACSNVLLLVTLAAVSTGHAAYWVAFGFTLALLAMGTPRKRRS